MKHFVRSGHNAPISMLLSCYELTGRLRRTTPGQSVLHWFQCWSSKRNKRRSSRTMDVYRQQKYIDIRYGDTHWILLN